MHANDFNIILTVKTLLFYFISCTNAYKNNLDQFEID